MKRSKKFIAGLALPIALLLLWGSWRQSTGPDEGSGLSCPPTSAPVRDSLRIGTFNIDGGEGIDGRLDLARTARCLQHLDFIGLNEVHGDLLADPPNQAIALGQLLNLPYLFVPAEHRWWHDSFGNAVFSDLPVTHWQRVVLPGEFFHARRNYLLSDVLWHDQTVHFVTTHVDWKSDGDEQLRIVTDVFLHLPLPAILMGDLNHPPGSQQIKQLTATTGVEEAISSILGRDAKPRVDWIFLRGLHTVDAGIVDIGASDHPAFWAAVE